MLTFVGLSICVVGLSLQEAVPLAGSDENQKPAVESSSYPRAEYERELDMLLAMLRQSGDLKPAQERRLQLAAKGAIQSSCRNFDKVVSELATKIYGSDPRDEMPNAEKLFQVTQDYATDKKNRLPSLSESLLWRQTAEKVLSQQQLDGLNKLLSEREKHFRTSAVMDFIARYDNRAYLSTTQRENLTRIVDKQHGLALCSLVRSAEMIFWAEPDAGAAPPIAHSELGFLSKRQMQNWVRFAEPILNRAANPGHIHYVNTNAIAKRIVPPPFWEEFHIE
jgi:hypothetical protein